MFTDLFFARAQMGTSLAFHMIFAAIGIGMPLLMVIAEALYLRTGDEKFLVLAKKWSKGTAIMFAVGAVSGTVLSFKLGLLWPHLMALAGAVIGLPLALEGVAFFLEAIFLGIYLYGWRKITPVWHLMAGIGVLISGTLSGVFVTIANAFLNSPTGFEIVDGRAVNIDPWAVLFNPDATTQVLHMTVASFQAVAFVVLGIHAWGLLRDRTNPYHRRAFGIALSVAIVTGLVQPLTGDLSAKYVARVQPVKLAAMEAHWETERGAPLIIGGIPDPEDEVTRFAIRIPYGLSILAHFDPQAEIMGLKDVPRDERPPVVITHFAFQIMVAAGMAMMGVSLLALALIANKRFRLGEGWQLPDERWFLRTTMLAAPLGMLAIEAGWFVTEFGRQPWILRGIMRTEDAVTDAPGLGVTFVIFTLLYLLLGTIVTVLLKRQVFDEGFELADEELEEIQPKEAAYVL